MGIDGEYLGQRDVKWDKSPTQARHLGTFLICRQPGTLFGMACANDRYHFTAPSQV